MPLVTRDCRPPIHIGTLETERLVLIPLDPDTDAGDLHAMYADPEAGAFGDLPPFTDVAQTREFLRRELADNGGTSWAIRLREEPAALGTIGIFADQVTTIRGIGWSLRRSHWGRGIMSEAARTVIPFLLGHPGVDALEAWVDVRNTRSLAVARNAGMTERGRLPRTYRDRIGQSLVMVAEAEPREAPVVSVEPVLAARDVAATVALFTEAVGLHVGWALGDPVSRAFLAVSPYSGSPGLVVHQAKGAVTPGALDINVAVLVDGIADRLRQRGVEMIIPPTDRPWHRRDASFRLAEGHLVRLAGAILPSGA